MRILSEAQLVDAVRRGIISPSQYDALLAMDPAEISAHFGTGAGIAELAAAADMGASREPPRGFNWITIIYYLGAITMMFAFGWFLLDRWRTLGPAGILAVTVTYALIFLGAGEYLRRGGYRVAGGLITAVAVGMTPLIVWAAQDLLGLWAYRPRAGIPDPFDIPFDRRRIADVGNWIVIEGATILASIVAYRRLRFPFLLAPAAVSFIFLPRHLSELALGHSLGRYSEVWIVAATGMALLTIAFGLDRKDRDRTDVAYWPYLVGVGVTVVGIAMLWERYPALHHLLPVVAVLMIAASLTLRRVIFLAAGGVMLYAYLSWLAFDLFRSSVFFPIVLATLGLGIIIGAVWFQRAYPRMVMRVNAGLADPRPWLPAGYATPVLATLFAITMTILALPADRAYRQDTAERMRRLEAEYRSADSVAGRRAAPPPPAADSSAARTRPE